MTSADPGQSQSAPSEQPLLDQLLPAGEPLTAAKTVQRMGLWERSIGLLGKPKLLLNMVTTADGRATLGGRSGPISDAADRALFHALRAASDGVLVGAGTVRMERYGRLIPDPETRRLRADRGLRDEPLACVVSGRLAFEPQTPLLQEPDAHIVMLTASAASLPEAAAHVDYIRSGEGQLDLPAALAELSERFEVQTLLCEGGPHLARELIAAGLLDELFLSISPRLIGGEPSGGEALRVLAGAELPEPAELSLLGVQRAESTLFLRYGVSARERVSRETTDSSSLAR